MLKVVLFVVLGRQSYLWVSANHGSDTARSWWS